MKTHLLYRDADLNMEKKLPRHSKDLVWDLGLTQLFDAMSRGDTFLHNVVQRVILFSLYDVETIRYRQGILNDCIENSDAVRKLYDFTIQSMKEADEVYFGYFARSPSSVLHGSLAILKILVQRLRELRTFAEEEEKSFHSEGFRKLFATLTSELSDDYFQEVAEHLKQLSFKDGELLSARLGTGNAGTDYVLRKPNHDPRSWLQKVFTSRAPASSFRLADRDESGARSLSELRDKGLNLVANAAGQSKDHILSFFTNLRTELAFYVGCLNLRQALTSRDLPVVFPEPFPAELLRASFNRLYDPGLALAMEKPVVGNSLDCDGRTLTVITGANQGGKSTFLRSIGVGHLLMQSGMFVPAEKFEASVCSGVFTHFRREEDLEMESGKFDEELRRMSAIVDAVRPYSLVLFNESFAATNEREGSEIAQQITRALVEKGVKVVFVTHMYEYARTRHQQGNPADMFLQPERKSDGTRTFKLHEGAPSSTSFGPDLYRRIFETGEKARGEEGAAPSGRGAIPAAGSRKE